MSYTLLSDDYRFFRIRFNHYHHTDSSAGCDLHFLALMVKGRAEIVTAEETLHIQAGQAFYFPKGLKYHSYWYGDPEIEFLSFGFAALPAGDRKRYILQTLPEEACLPELFGQLLRLMRTGQIHKKTPFISTNGHNTHILSFYYKENPSIMQ